MSPQPLEVHYLKTTNRSSWHCNITGIQENRKQWRRLHEYNNTPLKWGESKIIAKINLISKTISYSNNNEFIDSCKLFDDMEYIITLSLGGCHCPQVKKNSMVYQLKIEQGN